MQDDGVEAAPVLPEREVGVIAHAVIAFCLAVREYEHNVSELKIFCDGSEAFLAVFSAFASIPYAGTGAVFLDCVDEFVVVQDVGMRDKGLEMTGDC